MSALFEELDYCPTPIGALSLRRRRDLKLDVDVFEIKLGDESLMTSLFTASELALARLGIAALGPAAKPDVVVGGLGLGYTAHAVLEASTDASLIVVEALAPVIEWHESGLLPLGTALANNPR
ncbi:MAG: spermidine synthase, partial [Pseudomonadota bacterium]